MTLISLIRTHKYGNENKYGHLKLKKFLSGNPIDEESFAESNYALQVRYFTKYSNFNANYFSFHLLGLYQRNGCSMN
jgi:hypothetical protein